VHDIVILLKTFHGVSTSVDFLIFICYVHILSLKKTTIMIELLNFD